PILGMHHDARGIQNQPQPGGGTAMTLVLERRGNAVADQAIGDELRLHHVARRKAFDEISGRSRDLVFSLFLVAFPPLVVPRSAIGPDSSAGAKSGSSSPLYDVPHFQQISKESVTFVPHFMQIHMVFASGLASPKGASLA